MKISRIRATAVHGYSWKVPSSSLAPVPVNRKCCRQETRFMIRQTEWSLFLSDAHWHSGPLSRSLVVSVVSLGFSCLGTAGQMRGAHCVIAQKRPPPTAPPDLTTTTQHHPTPPSSPEETKQKHQTPSSSSATRLRPSIRCHDERPKLA